MIVDRLVNADRYASLNPAFKDAFLFLGSREPATLGVGTHEFESFTAIVVETEGNGRGGATLERHVRDIDIHFTVSGGDVIGWKAHTDLTSPAAEFDDSRDVQFFRDEPDMWVSVPQGAFAIQFPEDGHAPLAGESQIRKVILKIVDEK